MDAVSSFTARHLTTSSKLDAGVERRAFPAEVWTHEVPAFHTDGIESAPPLAGAKAPGVGNVVPLWEARKGHACIVTNAQGDKSIAVIQGSNAASGSPSVQVLLPGSQTEWVQPDSITYAAPQALTPTLDETVNPDNARQEMMTFLEQNPTDFPSLNKGDLQADYPSSSVFNCIANSVSDFQHWDWPTDPATGNADIAAFDKFYSSFNFMPLHSGPPTASDFLVQDGIDKVALYGLDPNTPEHAVLILPTGATSSKFGTLPCCELATPDSCDGPTYGKPIRTYVRIAQPRPDFPPMPPSSAS